MVDLTNHDEAPDHDQWLENYDTDNPVYLTHYIKHVLLVTFFTGTCTIWMVLAIWVVSTDMQVTPMHVYPTLHVHAV